MTNVQFLTARLFGNIELTYTDSGSVPGSTDYTTIDLIHGSAFNARKFMASLASNGLT